jgi:light-regulated signal transduction histidine kinase (bacteriophytochrome)
MVSSIPIEENILAEGDEHLLTIALKNLLENAFKYTSKVNKPEISFGKINIDNESVYYIRDNGVGFNMQYADKLFQAFQRLHNSSDFSGTGIGLSIVNRIISKHSGRIWAESELNKGATFYFTLNK